MILPSAGSGWGRALHACDSLGRKQFASYNAASTLFKDYSDVHVVVLMSSHRGALNV